MRYWQQVIVVFVVGFAIGFVLPFVPWTWQLVASSGGWVGAAVSGVGFALALKRYKEDNDRNYKLKVEHRQALDRAQWGNIYRQLADISAHAGLHDWSLIRLKAIDLSPDQEATMREYTQSRLALTLAVDKIMYELTLVPSCEETLTLTKFFFVDFPLDRTGYVFQKGILRMKELALAKAGGQPLAILDQWVEELRQNLTPDSQ